jgi:hypothetical protein
MALAGQLPGFGQGEDLPLPQEKSPGASSAQVPVPPVSFMPSAVADKPSVPVPMTPVPGHSRTSSTAVPSSTSSSGQFIVYGPDLRVRSGIAGKCEEISQELGGLLRTSDPWVRTIVVQIKPLTSSDPPDLGITTQVSALTHGGFHLQLNVPERSGLRPADFRRELIRLLLMERLLRPHKRLADDRNENLVPSWVHTGVLKALDYRSRGRPSAEFAAIFKSGKVYGIEEILEAEAAGLDGLSRTIYETSCCALVLAVIDQPEGPLRFSRFLASLAQGEKPQRELLKQWFPALAESDTTLNKWWSLQLASLATPSVAETLDPTQTAELLDRALTFMVPAIEGRKLPEPKKIMSLASQRPAPLPQEAPIVETEKTPKVANAASSSSKKAGAGKSAKPPTKSVSSRPKDLPAAPVVAEEPTEEEKAKRGFLRNLLPFGRGGSDEAKVEPVTEEAKKEEMTREGEGNPTREDEAAAKESDKQLKKAQEKEAKEKAAQEKADRERAEKEKEAQEKEEKEKAKMVAAEAKKADEGKPADSKTEPVPEKPKAEEKAPVEGERGRSLNPLKWFRGGKEKKNEAEAPKGEGASVRLFDPAALYVWNLPPLKPSRPLGDRIGEGIARFIQAPAVSPPPTLERTDEPVIPAIEGGSQTIAPLVPVPGDAQVSGEGNPFPVEDFAVVMGHPQKQELLSQTRLALQDVAIRGNALFRDVANDYITVINELSVGKTKGIDERLKVLRTRAVETYVLACAVRDHLDWFEATQSTRYSGLFEDFLNLPERVREELPARKDPISKYLDEVEALIGR